MNRRGFFASLLCAAVGPPAAARALAQPPFICAPGQITAADWTAPNAQPRVFHPASFNFSFGGFVEPNVLYIGDPETGIWRKA